jgi:hypothetical protein
LLKPATCAGRPAIPPAGEQVRLLGQLAAARDQVLAVHVAQAGGQLPELRRDRVPVLPDQHDPADVVDATTPTAPLFRTTSRSTVPPPDMVTWSV